MLFMWTRIIITWKHSEALKIFSSCCGLILWLPGSPIQVINLEFLSALEVYWANLFPVPGIMNHRIHSDYNFYVAGWNNSVVLSLLPVPIYRGRTLVLSYRSAAWPHPYPFSIWRRAVQQYKAKLWFFHFSHYSLAEHSCNDNLLVRTLSKSESLASLSTRRGNEGEASYLCTALKFCPTCNWVPTCRDKI